MSNKYYDSQGNSYTQATINKKLRDTYKGMLVKYICEGCVASRAVDHDHTISQKRCKELHKTELIWDESNIEFSCRLCHNDFESYKSGEFQNHKNWIKRMLYINTHDNELYMKRFMYLTDSNKKLLNDALESSE